jgi:uncharacterized RDD family membrane protein YckC
MYIVNPEPIIEIAQKRMRILAFFIDYFIFSITAIILVSNLQALISLPLLFFLFFFHWPISESLYGQTIGKRVLGIKVVSYDLKPANFGQTLIRFVFGIIDMQLLIGLMVASADKDNRRIGDRVASTIVIVKNNSENRNRR